MVVINIYLLWGVGGKGWGSSLQKRGLHTYTFKLGQSRISILYKKFKKKKNYGCH